MEERLDSELIVFIADDGGWDGKVVLKESVRKCVVGEAR
jgi:hypothetical protein